MRHYNSDFLYDYRQLVADCVRYGDLRTARGRTHRAMFNVVLEHNCFGNLLAGLNKRFAIAELMAYVAGWDDVAWLGTFCKNVAQFSDDGERFAGAYGPRMVPCWPNILRLLTEDQDTRQAYVPIYDQGDLGNPSKDIPCNVGFQLQAHGGHLNMAVFQRSSDLIWGLPYDHLSFTCLLVLVAGELNLVPGMLTRFITNAHVYVPEAGYASSARIQAALETVDSETWWPIPADFYRFQLAAIETRADFENSVAEPRWPQLMKELR